MLPCGWRSFVVRVYVLVGGFRFSVVIVVLAVLLLVLGLFVGGYCVLWFLLIVFLN